MFPTFEKALWTPPSKYTPDPVPLLTKSARSCRSNTTFLQSPYQVIVLPWIFGQRSSPT